MAVKTVDPLIDSTIYTNVCNGNAIRSIEIGFKPYYCIVDINRAIGYPNASNISTLFDSLMASGVAQEDLLRLPHRKVHKWVSTTGAMVMCRNAFRSEHRKQAAKVLKFLQSHEVIELAKKRALHTIDVPKNEIYTTGGYVPYRAAMMALDIAVSADRNGFEPEQVQEITGRTLSPAARSFED